MTIRGSMSTHRTAHVHDGNLFNSVHQHPRLMSVATSHQRSAPHRRLGTERVMCLALPVNVNHVLILSNPIARLPLAKLFVASWEARHGQEFGR
jgi:hypothetical protein